MNRNAQNNKKEEKEACCNFHPKQVVVGVCPLCLNERLLLLQAAKQDHHHHRLQNKASASSSSIQKIFAFGSLFTTRHHQLKSHDYYYDLDDDASPTTPEDSFISMKFEENGVASWEKSTSNKVCVVGREVLDKDTKESKMSVVEHGKSNNNNNNAFRWRKRMGRLVHFIQWKRSNKGGTSSSCSVGHVEGVNNNKVRKGWMRTLTKRRTVE